MTKPCIMVPAAFVATVSLLGASARADESELGEKPRVVAPAVAPAADRVPADDATALRASAAEGVSKPSSPESVSAASTAPMRLRDARRAVEELRYDDALAIVTTIGPDAPPSLRVQALELHAVILLIRGRAALAQALIEELFFLAPAFQLSDPSLPPRVTKMFEEEAARPHKRGVTMEVEPFGDDLRSFALRAGGATRKVALACRVSDRAPFLPLSTELRKGRAIFRLPNDGAFSCHATAFDRDALPLGRLATARAPFAIQSRLPPEVPALTERWWFWTAVSGVVVGAVVVSAVALTAEEPPPDADITVEIPGSTAATIARW